MPSQGPARSGHANGQGCLSSLESLIVGADCSPSLARSASATRNGGRIEAATDGFPRVSVPLIGARDSLLPPPRDRDAPVGRHAVLTPFQDSCLGGRSGGTKGRLRIVTASIQG